MTGQTTIDTAGSGDRAAAAPPDQPPVPGLRGHPWFTLTTVAVDAQLAQASEAVQVGVAPVAILVALLTKRGENAGADAGVGHI
ncbi:hypothetical protein [Streptomyces fuscichromogenes]|uniref:Uncharacterized protein n=1 Tax=Streptomyces fuscichromogenes TaxID=1324013 RepID=A0A917UG62_9ACTN|nr:hypothetical protein [Streptomyces fuscichromogenes]GGM85331.1 hypothetical protein GCM10011578_000130 [Streptomyces fuscichromogenes]